MVLIRKDRIKWLLILIVSLLTLNNGIALAKNEKIKLYGVGDENTKIFSLKFGYRDTICPILEIEKYTCSPPPKKLKWGINGEMELAYFNPVTGEIVYKGSYGIGEGRCYYVNPFCSKEVKQSVENIANLITIGNILKHITLSKFLIESATMGVDVFYYSFKDKELHLNELSLFTVLFNQLTPLFENLALFLFELGFLIYAIIFGWNRLSEKLAGYEYPYKPNFLSSFMKGGLIFVLFGLPINPPDVPKDLKYEPAPVPLILYVFKYPILKVDEMMTDIGGNMISFVGKYLLDHHIDFAEKFLKLQYKFHTNLITQKSKLEKELQEKCIRLANNCDNGDRTIEDYEIFIVSDHNLEGVGLCKANGTPVENKIEKAKYCRKLAMVYDGLKTALENMVKEEDLTVKVLSKLKGDRKKLVPQIENFSNTLKEQLGSLSSGVGLPIVYIYIKQKIYDELEGLQEVTEHYQIDIQPIKEKNKEINILVHYALVPTLVVSIPPFSDLFNIIKQLTDATVEALDTIIVTFLVSSFLSGNISLTALSLIGWIVVKTMSGLSTFIALFITYFLVTTVLPYLFYLAIAYAVVLRFGNLVWDIVKYVWTLPFMVYSLLLTRSEEIISDFLKHIITYTLLLALIVVSPVVGLFIYELFNILINYTFYITFTQLKMFDFGFLIGDILLNIFFAVTYILGMLIGTFMGVKATYQFPDMVLSHLKTSVQSLSKVSEEAFHSIATKFTPKV
jgi:hypothetical protein